MRVGKGAVTDGTIALEAGETARLDSKVDASTPGRQVRPADEPSPFAQILHGLGKEMDRGEKLMSGAIHGVGGGSGKELDNGSLLALQAGVYRYSEAVDLSAKLVDRASSGVKTILQGQ